MERVGIAVPGLVRRRDLVSDVHEPGAELRRQRVRRRRHLVVRDARLPDQAADAGAYEADAGTVCRSDAGAQRGTDAKADGKTNEAPNAQSFRGTFAQPDLEPDLGAFSVTKHKSKRGA